MSKNSLPLPWSAILFMQDNCSLQKLWLCHGCINSRNHYECASILPCRQARWIYVQTAILQTGLHQYDVAKSPVHAGLQCRGWLIYLCRLWKPRSSLLSVSHGLVYINIPGRTCLHELFIGYEQVTAWVARFSFKLETNYHQPPFALDGSMGRRTSRRHYSFD